MPPSDVVLPRHIPLPTAESRESYGEADRNAPEKPIDNADAVDIAYGCGSLEDVIANEPFDMGVPFMSLNDTYDSQDSPSGTVPSDDNDPFGDIDMGAFSMEFE